MTISKLQNELDIKFSAVVNELKKTSKLNPIDFAGTVAGFLIITGIYMAVKGGCPRKILQNQLNQNIEDAYKNKGNIPGTS